MHYAITMRVLRPFSEHNEGIMEVGEEGGSAPTSSRDGEGERIFFYKINTERNLKKRRKVHI